MNLSTTWKKLGKLIGKSPDMTKRLFFERGWDKKDLLTVIEVIAYFRTHTPRHPGVDRMVTVKEAAEYLKVSVATIRKHIKNGLLRRICDLDNTMWVSWSSLEQFKLFHVGY